MDNEPKSNNRVPRWLLVLLILLTGLVALQLPSFALFVVEPECSGEDGFAVFVEKVFSTTGYIPYLISQIDVFCLFLVLVVVVAFRNSTPKSLVLILFVALLGYAILGGTVYSIRWSGGLGGLHEQ